MSNPAIILNGDQVYTGELVRENARLTVQVEAERQHRQKGAAMKRNAQRVVELLTCSNVRLT